MDAFIQKGLSSLLEFSIRLIYRSWSPSSAAITAVFYILPRAAAIFSKTEPSKATVTLQKTEESLQKLQNPIEKVVIVWLI